VPSLRDVAGGKAARPQVNAPAGDPEPSSRASRVGARFNGATPRRADTARGAAISAVRPERALARGAARVSAHRRSTCAHATYTGESDVPFATRAACASVQPHWGAGRAKPYPRRQGPGVQTLLRRNRHDGRCCPWRRCGMAGPRRERQEAHNARRARVRGLVCPRADRRARICAVTLRVHLAALPTAPREVLVGSRSRW
jgi:hypothetical protein